METPTIIGALMALLAALIVYAIFVPKSSRKFEPDNAEISSRNPMIRLISSIGNDIYGAMPAQFDKQDERLEHPRIKSLLIRSGNPWGLTAEEYIAFRWISAFLGFILGWGVWAVLAKLLGINIHWGIVVAGVTLFCYFIPKIKYDDQAKKRDMDFRKQLPDALELLRIAMAGISLSGAMREILPNMDDGLIKSEFQNIVKILDSGGTLQEALDQFAERAPNDGILTFIRAVQSASEVNAPMGEILESRARASREEFFALIHQKTAQLESQMWLVLAPTLIPAVAIIATAPSLVAMLETMG